MENSLDKKYNKDMKIWDDCAKTYEDQIVGGHPDIVKFEQFEESFIDKILVYLGKKTDKAIKLIDIGCGSGRLHVRYGKHVKIPSLEIVKGLDFSENMLNIARGKLQKEGISDSFYPALKFEQGSAFDLGAEGDAYLPVAVNLVNSIGVMQGEAGAQKLFESMRRVVETAGGIAFISNYQKEYVESFALPLYESTCDVCGQPRWMVPNTFASEKYKLMPKAYKRAHSKEPGLLVDVYENGQLIEKDFKLTRDEAEARRTIETGHIRTHANYDSNWYSFDQMQEWIDKYWAGLPTIHLPTNRIDTEKAEAWQFSILDVNNQLEGFDFLQS